MNMLLKTSVGVLALMAGAGIAMAQTDTGSGALGTGAMPSSMTCADIVDLGDQEVEQRLYFIAGYQAAQGATGTDTAASATTDMPSDTTASTDTGSATTGTDSTAAADTEMESDTMASDTTGDDAAAGGTDPTTTAGTSGATGTTGAAGGFVEIPVETVMTECENNPDTLIMDILEQQGAGAQ